MGTNGPSGDPSSTMQRPPTQALPPQHYGQQAAPVSQQPPVSQMQAMSLTGPAGMTAYSVSIASLSKVRLNQIENL